MNLWWNIILLIWVYKTFIFYVCIDRISLGKLKKMNIQNYNGRINVNIRQFYKHTISGEDRAGTQGITLSIDQWKTLATHVFIIASYEIYFVSFLL